jgi:hypothetical protein
VYGRTRARCEKGQGTVEWIGLVLLVSLLMVALAATLGSGLPGASLARSVAGRIICALDLGDACAQAPELVAEYGLELAEQVRKHAPTIAYEDGMVALPVDYRTCRESSCASGAPSGVIWRTSAGQPVVAFVHVVDCRPASEAAPRSADCTGARSGNLYVQYWFYYPESATGEGSITPEQVRAVSTALGHPSHHPDDWESYQVRAGAGGADARASSHHGYNYGLSRANWASDAGIEPAKRATETLGLREEGGWGPETHWLYVSGGSHAGHAHESDGELLRNGYERLTPGAALTMIPLERIAGAEGESVSFAVTPPWLKEVWSDPESEGT